MNITSCISQNKQLNDEIKKLKNDLNENNELLKMYMEKTGNANQNISTINSKCKLFEDLKNKCETEKLDLTNKLNICYESKSKLEKSLNICSVEKTGIQSDLQNYYIDNNKLIDDIKSCETKYTDLSTSCRTYKNDVNEMTNKYNICKSDKDNLYIIYDQCSKENISMKSKYSEIKVSSNPTPTSIPIPIPEINSFTNLHYGMYR